jgi:ABC-type uncharacterized transport system substrate-binding protein
MSDALTERRLFIGLVAGGLLACSLRVSAQRAGQPYRLGYLRLGVGMLPRQFWDAMRELGWIEGKHINMLQRNAMTRDDLPQLAAELVRLKVDLILTESIPATRAAMEATKTIPIVFTIGGDPVTTGLVTSLARPGGNVTGYTLGLYDEKMLQILKAALPRATRLAVPAWGEYPSRVTRAARELGMEVQGFDVPEPDDIGHFFDSARMTGADAVFIPNIPSLNPMLERLGLDATNAHLPAIAWARSFARAGGLLSYGPVAGSQNLSRTAVQIDRILKGAKPGEIAVEMPTQFAMVVNLKTAKALGLTIPQSLLLRADEVIQ